MEFLCKKSFLFSLFLIYYNLCYANDYQIKLGELVNTGFNADSMQDPKWDNLYSLINQNVLNDAGEKNSDVKEIFSMFNPIPRSTKSIERVKKKISYDRPDTGFKANSDFTAIRIHVDVDQIAITVKEILDIVDLHDGKSFIRNYICDESGSLNDIVQYIFVYIPSIGYITEIQVGHPFASFTFTRDTWLRDNPGENSVDLWENNFYMNVRSKILDQSWEFDVLSALNLLYQDNPVELELLEILKPYI